jgi:hypothetical protein
MDIRTTAPYLESCLSNLLAEGDLACGLLTKATYSCGTASESHRLRCREAVLTLSHVGGIENGPRDFSGYGRSLMVAATNKLGRGT